MVTDPARARSWKGHAGLVFLAATLIRMVFVFAFPTIHGGDAAARLASPFTLVLGYQLPLPQLFVALGKWMHDDPIVVRLIFCIWGGVLASGVTALLSRVASTRAAWFGGLLTSFDPLLIHYSIVPYQEAVAYGLLAWAFYFASGTRPVPAALLLAAACASRFECWLFLPAFLLVSRSWRATAIAALPVAFWMVWWQGLAPGGLYVLDLDPQAERLSRFIFLGRKFIEYETAFLAALATLSILLAFRHKRKRILDVIVAVSLPIFVVITLGHEYPPGSGLLSERLLHLPILLALLLAAVALDHAASWSRLALLICVAAALSLALRHTAFQTRLLQAAADEPDLALARDAARAIEATRGHGECVSVVAPRVDPKLIEAYILKVAASFGDVARARERARALEYASPDADRVAAHVRAKSGTIRTGAGCSLLLIVDSAGGEQAMDLSEATLLAEINAGSRRALLVRTPR